MEREQAAIEALYKESKACVRVEAELTEEFDVKQRLRQGCLLCISVVI